MEKLAYVAYNSAEYVFKHHLKSGGLTVAIDVVCKHVNLCNYTAVADSKNLTTTFGRNCYSDSYMVFFCCFFSIL